MITREDALPDAYHLTVATVVFEFAYCSVCCPTLKAEVFDSMLTRQLLFVGASMTLLNDLFGTLLRVQYL